MPELTRNEVEHIATLAHLDLTENEKKLFVRQLANILNYFEELQQLDTSGVLATSHVHNDFGTEREDKSGVSLPVTDAIANAPDPDPEAGLFKVPRVI